MAVALKPGHYFGELLSSHKSPGFTLSETRYAPGSRLPSHSHENSYFCLVIEGSYTESSGRGRARACRPAALLFHPAGEPHTDSFHEAGGRCFNIEPQSDWWREVAQPVAPLDAPTRFKGDRANTLVGQLYDEFVIRDDASTLAIEGLVLALVAQAARANSSRPERGSPPWLNRAKEFIHSAYRQRLTTAEIADAAGVHPVHLARTFRQHHDCTIGECVRRLRVDYARRRLAASDDPIASIALDAGFSDQSHLSRAFRCATGTTPARYRRRAHLR